MIALGVYVLHYEKCPKYMMTNSYIPVNEPLLNGNEKKYLEACIDSGWISSEGPFVEEFEKAFAKRVGRKHAIAVTNGTAAIDLAVEALSIGSGDEVILPTFTIISCVMQIIRNGAIPVLVDCNPDTWCMDVSQIEEKITPRTKAIMVVHIYGLPVDMSPVLELAKKYGIKVIEDAAEAHGQLYKEKNCGSFGDISTFSFYTNKHITTGEGGMLLTDSDELANTCRSLRNLCFKPEQRFVHDRLGWNLRMTNLQAAIGLAQLERLDYFLGLKRAMGQRYLAGLKDISKIQLPVDKLPYALNNYWVFGVVLDEELNITAREAMKELQELGVGTRPFFWPLHEQPLFAKSSLFKGEVYPNAERIARKGFYIPSGMSLTEEKIDDVINRFNQLSFIENM